DAFLTRRAGHRNMGSSSKRHSGGGRLGDGAAIARVVSKLPVAGNDQAQRRRRMVAEFCKLIGAALDGNDGNGNGAAKSLSAGLGLSPRVPQTLDGLL